MQRTARQRFRLVLHSEDAFGALPKPDVQLPVEPATRLHERQQARPVQTAAIRKRYHVANSAALHHVS